jgi:NADP-dependent aldehyde dehydrogenase
MLNQGIRSGYEEGVSRLGGTPGLRILGSGPEHAGPGGRPAIFVTDAATFMARPHLHDEVFGPVSLVVQADDADQLLKAARALGGNLTASVHATDAELAEHGELIDVLQSRVGRLIVNGFPTGVEVCPSMHHGGPWPATTDVRSTSVGTAAIFRFARPVCYQDFPQAALPPTLRDANPGGILRMVDGQMTRDAIGADPG